MRRCFLFTNFTNKYYCEKSGNFGTSLYVFVQCLLLQSVAMVLYLGQVNSNRFRNARKEWFPGRCNGVLQRRSTCRLVPSKHRCRPDRTPRSARLILPECFQYAWVGGFPASTPRYIRSKLPSLTAIFRCQKKRLAFFQTNRFSHYSARNAIAASFFAAIRAGTCPPRIVKIVEIKTKTIA